MKKKYIFSIFPILIILWILWKINMVLFPMKFCNEKEYVKIPYEKSEINISCEKDLDINSFKILWTGEFIIWEKMQWKTLAKDKNNIYILHQNISNFKVYYSIRNKVKNINSYTFKKLYSIFYTDNENVYIWYVNKNIQKLDFKKIPELDNINIDFSNYHNKYIKNQGKLFYFSIKNNDIQIHELKWINIENFKPLSEWSEIYTDWQNLIYKWEVKTYIDLDTLWWISHWWPYTQDKNNVYDKDFNILWLKSNKIYWFFYQNGQYISDWTKAFLISEIYTPWIQQRVILDTPIQVPFYKKLQKEYQEEIWKEQNWIY